MRRGGSVWGRGETTTKSWGMGGGRRKKCGKLLGGGATIRIGQEIWCLPYPGFFKNCFIAGPFKEYVLQPDGSTTREGGGLRWRRQTNRQTYGDSNSMTDNAQFVSLSLEGILVF